MSSNDQSPWGNLAFSDEIRYRIFARLSAKELAQVAGVCRCWRTEARKMLSKRNKFESLILPLWITPYNNGVSLLEGGEFWDIYFQRLAGDPISPVSPLAITGNWEVGQILRCVPKVFYVFYDDTADVTYPFCTEYVESLPRSTLYTEAGFLRMTLDGTELFGVTNIGAGLALPSTPLLQCHMLDISSYFEAEYIDHYDIKQETYSINLAMRELSSLALSPDSNCFIVLLNRSKIEEWQEGPDWKFETYINAFISHLTKSLDAVSYSLLGTGCSWIASSSRSQPWSTSEFTNFTLIYGSAFKSWSIVIALNLSPAQMIAKLKDLKRNIDVNSSAVALCSYPVDKTCSCWSSTDQGLCGVSHLDPTEIFKRVFPKITLTCFYDDQDYSQFGCNTLDHDENPVFVHKKSLIYLILAMD
ncbi:uncharacterized protein LOC131671334 [Phymastichus coffea]|uniref:uncharacterized protein LOC131671334 n=1 Tax=Phymastichus coffea TaxID=108790 RepID=UPI00273BB759|nr:uncharacterized protein LOC131671334 [Phymastichus coffea]